jgi:hypothetical protein
MAQIKANFTALKHQIEFARITAKNSAIVGGYGSGKSQAVVFRALESLKRRDNGTVCVIAPTYSLLEDVNIPDFEEILRHYRVPFDFRKKDRKMVITSGEMRGEIWFRTGDRPEKIVGFDATDIIIDEFDILSAGKQKELWRKALGRIRGAENSTISIATTPEGFRMTYDLFEKQKIGPMIKARTIEPRDYVAEMARQYDPLLIRQYMNAEFVNINGLAAYYGFSRDRNHRATLPGEVDAYPAIGVGWDFNVAKMCCMLFVHDASAQRIHFFDEIIVKGASYYGESPTQRACRIIKERYPRHQLRAYPDATGARRSTSSCAIVSMRSMQS